MNLTQRSIRSSAYSVSASLIQTAIQLIRSIILARLLEPQVFGVYAFAASIIIATRSLASFGLGGALLHRAQESEGETALQVHFTLSLLLGTLWLALMGGVGAWLITPENRWVLWVIAGTEFIDQLTYTARSALVRRVDFQRISLINILITVGATLAAIVLAWRGFGVWSLVATDIVAALVVVLGYYVFRPVWRPRLGWSSKVVRYFLGFGGRAFVAGALQQVLDEIDDLWTGVFLGETSLGFYSRAYTFATYPRRVLAYPVGEVASGTYAELKDRPRRLSQAFFRVNALMVRSGFLFAGLLALVAPEFIRIVIGTKWLPMLTAFRLMLVFTLLDPIRLTVASLFVAVGEPEKTVRVRGIQLVILVIGLFTLGSRWDIEGVALAVNLMLVVGMAMFFWQARAHVEFSLLRLFGVPTVALLSGMALARGAILVPGVLGNPWRSGGVKIAVFLLVYSGLLLLLERQQVPRFLNSLRSMWGKAISSSDDPADLRAD